MATKTLDFVIGNVGRDPEPKMAGDKRIVEFSIARPTGLGRDAGQPDWFTVAVWDESVGEQVRRKISKGDTVAVIGPVRENHYNGKTYLNISAYRVGLVSYLYPENKDMFPESSKAKTKVDDDDDLGF